MVRPGRDRLAGSMQVDETYIGGEKPGKRGRGGEGKALVLIAPQEHGEATGRILLKQVADASAESLQAAVQEAIEVVKTEGWSGYNGLRSLGYRHEVIRNTADVGKNLLPLCHREAALIKRWLAGTHQGTVRHGRLSYYLDEYRFRFNRHRSGYRGKLFYRLRQNAFPIDPVQYDDVTLALRGPRSRQNMLGFIQ
jgi:transposase-like protein